MNQFAWIKAEVTFLSEAEGGRSVMPPDLNSGSYRPHLVVGDPKQRKASSIGNVIQETYLGIAFVGGPVSILPGETFLAKMLLLFFPHPSYDSLAPGATFTVREGAKVVAFGKVKQLLPCD